MKKERKPLSKSKSPLLNPYRNLKESLLLVDIYKLAFLSVIMQLCCLHLQCSASALQGYNSLSIQIKAKRALDEK